VPHVLSHLPAGTELDAKVYLTALDHPTSGLAHRHSVVLSLSHPLFHYAETLFGQGAESAGNVLVHELTHSAYEHSWFLRTEPTLENGNLQWLIDELQNEGLATYVAYQVQDQYPSPLDTVYMRMDSALWVRTLVARLNRLWAKADALEPAAFARKVAGVWDGRKQANILGGYMARTIDERLGRDALAATVAEGPIAFIRAYNAAADEGMRIAFDAPEPPDSVYLDLRSAVVAEDLAGVERLLADLETGGREPNTYETYVLYAAGQMLLRRGHTNLARRVFQHHVAVAPDNGNGYLGLGESYQVQGAAEPMVEAFEKGLELNPRAVWAALALQEVAHDR
jgi:hypothetical protein